KLNCVAAAPSAPVVTVDAESIAPIAFCGCCVISNEIESPDAGLPSAFVALTIKGLARGLLTFPVC
ncbi:MAG TPA: hypothetical protein VKV15_28890, partial [Bryobacteraceae bacterium]|nr:hypothetical protein [Bryobacteraceae bacterium]